MDEIKIIEKTVEDVKSFFKDDRSGHDWWHVYRVWQLAKTIQRNEGGDKFIVEMAALLHDLDDHKFAEKDNGENPVNVLKCLSQFDLDQKTVDIIINTVMLVSFKGALVPDEMQTIEGKIVQDSDRLDAIGAVGIARVFAFGGYKGDKLYDPLEKPNLHKTFKEYKKKDSSSINHFYEKLLLLKDRMNTETGKKIAEKRHQYMLSYLEEFFQEWDGDDI